MERVRAWVSLVGWLAGLTTVIAVFTALGDGALAGPPLTEPGSWGGWAAQRDAATAAAATLRLVVVALAWYLVGVTTLGVTARLSRATRAVAVADAVAVPVVRHLLRTALGVGLATSVVTSTAIVGPAVRTAGAETVRAVAVEHAAATPTLLEDPDSRPVGLGPPGAGTVGRAASAGSGGPHDRTAEHEVAPGEHLWSIAEDHLSVGGRTPSAVEVFGHWERLIELNRDRLADPRAPDLIFPGQRFRLPPLPALPDAGYRR